MIYTYINHLQGTCNGRSIVHPSLQLELVTDVVQIKKERKKEGRNDKRSELYLELL